MTTQQKITILENIDWDYITAQEFGLCGFISKVSWDIFYTSLHGIELLTKENAFQFSSRAKRLTGNLWEGAAYWFDKDKQGYQERRQYVNWMIEQYKKSLN
jgi:hypothetical protein